MKHGWDRILLAGIKKKNLIKLRFQLGVNNKCWVELEGFNVELELRNGLLPNAWDSSQRLIHRHALKILIRQGGDGSLALVLPEE